MRAGQLGNLLARGKKYAPAALVLLAGVILLLLPSGKEAPAEIRSGEGAAEPFELEAFEEKLERSLSAIEGAGETRVVLTLESRAWSLCRPWPPVSGELWWCAREETTPRCGCG